MTDNEMSTSEVRPYADAARLWRVAGWKGVIPLGSGPARKGPVPVGYTGWQGVDPSRADVEAWIETHGNRNVGIRIPQGYYCLDRDAAPEWVALEAKCGPLPATWSSTSRGKDSLRRILWFRAELPEGRMWKDHPTEGVDSVHVGHRYVCSWPSIHDKSGEQYMSYAPDGSEVDGPVPHDVTIARLPEAWIQACSREGQALDPGTGIAAQEARDIIAKFPKGEPCKVVTDWLSKERGRLSTAAANSIHDPGKLQHLALLGLEGHAGVPAALYAHQDAFTDAKEQHRGMNNGAASAEWWRMVVSGIDKGLVKKGGVILERCGHVEQAPKVDDQPEPVGNQPEPARSRRVDLAAFLDGTYVSPEPTAGGARSDGRQVMYPGKWHTLIAPTATGKSFFAMWMTVEEMRKGNTVIYAHFEEGMPGGTIARLRRMAPELTNETIAKLFVWVDCSRVWKKSEWVAMLAEGEAPTLVILDGINAASTQHGQDPSIIEAPGFYRDLFVTPATALDAAVLSLGHPPKAKGRENEAHGFGSTAWLDVMDGVGLRLEKGTPAIRRGHLGGANLFSVKDRYGMVEQYGVESQDKGKDGWYDLGYFWLDDTSAEQRVGLKAPATEVSEGMTHRDTLDTLADKVLSFLFTQEREGFSGIRDLSPKLRGAGVSFKAADLASALERLVYRGVLDWPPAIGPTRPRPGRLKGDAWDMYQLKRNLPNA